jgi:hypothetical protein
LHRLLARATALGGLSQLPIRDVTLRASLYADDAVIFLNPVKEKFQRTLAILHDFGNASGLRINPS